MKTELSTILRTYQWGGMGNRSLIGCTSCMVLVKNSSVKSVVVQVTGDEELLKNTFKSGDTHTE